MLFLFRQAVGKAMAGGTFAGQLCVEIETTLCWGRGRFWYFFKRLDFHADLRLVVAVFGSLPDCRSRVTVQNVPQCWNASIMKIGGAAPDPVQRWRNVADWVDFDVIFAISA